MALTAVVDHNGVAVNVGDTVYIRGTVLEVSNASAHFREVRIQIAYPVPGVPNAELAGFAPTVHGSGQQHYPGSDQVICCTGTMLTH